MKNTTETAKVIPFKKKKNHKKLAAIAGLGVLVVFMALFTPWFNIKSIEVKGNSRIKQEDIIKASGISIGQNIFRVNYFHAKSNIKQDFYIEKVSITRNYPNEVVINIEERKRAGYIQIEGKYVIMDKNGVALEAVDNSKGIDAPNILGLKFNNYELGQKLKPNKEDKEKFDLLLNCFNEISSSGLDGKLSKIDVSNPDNIVIWVYNDKYQINIGDNENFDYKLNFSKTIMDKQENDKGPSGTISFSSEHKAVFIPR